MQYVELLDRAECYAFEDEIRGLMEVFGYTAETTKPSGDFGADVVGWHSGKRVVVQCKLYTRGKIGNKIVGELEGTRRYYDATHAVIVTTSSFTKAAREMAGKLGIYLIDREALIQLCRQKGITIPSATWLTPLEDGATSGVWDIAAHKLPHAGEFTIGRAAANDLVIPDARISRHHAIIVRRGLRLTIADRGSGNGTFLNGHRLAEGCVLNYGDRVAIRAGLAVDVSLSARRADTARRPAIFFSAFSAA